ncbi:MAG: hypothetical protein BGP10_12400 [Rhodanobacter sp. 68-29]|nr:hypothetical protein [Rhodanobacter sp.]ODV27987.1 MAG: hypothetical protein ABT19_00320 [Rhodanobacter sp. SCN 68-63]OJY60691.1 MAG: hypothetical protein BGP10_12400 [Rhodanobacter sp. 68-29]
MALSLASLLPDYKAALHDAASVFKGTPAGADPATQPADPDADFKRHLGIAARAIGIDGKRSCTRLGALTLVAGQSLYTDVPEDLLTPKASDWGIGAVPVWQQPAGALPVVRLSDQDGAPVLVLTPAPSAAQISTFGADYRYYYLATPVLTDSGSTLRDGDRDLVILRAMVEAARELVNRNLHKPIALSPGSGSYPSNQTPASWHAMLLAEYKAAA